MDNKNSLGADVLPAESSNGLFADVFRTSPGYTSRETEIVWR